jgi:hypothetical protein
LLWTICANGHCCLSLLLILEKCDPTCESSFWRTNRQVDRPGHDEEVIPAAGALDVFRHAKNQARYCVEPEKSITNALIDSSNGFDERFSMLIGEQNDMDLIQVGERNGRFETRYLNVESGGCQN